MRSTTLFALAAASGIAFAEQADSFKVIKNIVDNDINSDFGASASGSFKAGADIGTQFIPIEGAKKASPPKVSSKDSKISARDVDQEFEAAASGSLKLGGTVGTEFAPVAVAGKQDARPFISTKSAKMPARDVDQDFEASGSAAFKLGGTFGTEFVPVAVAGKQDARPFISAKSSKISARQSGTQQVYGQCGGGRYSGPTQCAAGSNCYRRDASYSQCLPLVQQAYGQCAGNSYFGTNVCAQGSSCKQLRSDYSQCIPNGSKVNAKAVAPEEDNMMTADMDPKHTSEGEDVDPVHASMSAEMYKTEEASAPAYTSTEAASYMTKDTMMAMPTTETKSESSMMAMPTQESSSIMMAKPTTEMAMPTTYATNATKTEGSPAASGTGMNKPVPYEGAASGLMVPGMVLGAGMALVFGMLL